MKTFNLAEYLAGEMKNIVKNNLRDTLKDPKEAIIERSKKNG